MKVILLQSLFILGLTLCSFGQQASLPPAANGASIPLAAQGAAVQEGIAPSQKPKTVKFAEAFSLTYNLPSAGAPVIEAQKDFTLTAYSADKENPNLITVDIMPFNLGVSTLTAITFELADGSKIKSSPLEIEIQSSDIKTKAQGLIDIRSPYRPFNWETLIWIFFAILLVSLTVLYISLKKKKPAVINNGPYGGDLRPVYIIALERLDNLDSSDLWGKGLYKEFYIELIDIFRDYLSVRFNIDAHSCTSRELERRLLKEFSSEQFSFLFRKDAPPADYKSILPKIKELNASADLVKFARQLPSEGIKNRDISDAKEIILFTKKEEPAPEDKTPKQETSLEPKKTEVSEKEDGFSQSGGLP